MIKSKQDQYSAERLRDELREEQEAMSTILEQNYDSDIERAINDRVEQIHAIEAELAAFSAVQNAEHAPPVLSIVDHTVAGSVSRGLFLARTARGLSQTDIATRIGKKQSLISKWENPPLDSEECENVELRTLYDWGNATGYGLRGFFINKNQECLSADSVMAVSLELTAIASELGTRRKVAISAAVSTIQHHLGADVVTCYEPSRMSNSLVLAGYKGVRFPQEMAGVIRVGNVPMRILSERRKSFGNAIENVLQDRNFEGSWFVLREEIKSVMYVIFETSSGPGLFFLSFRNQHKFSAESARVIRLLSLHVSAFFEAITPRRAFTTKEVSHAPRDLSSYLRAKMSDAIHSFEEDRRELLDGNDSANELVCFFSIKGNEVAIDYSSVNLDRIHLPESSFRNAIVSLMSARQNARTGTILLSEASIPQELSQEMKGWEVPYKSVFFGEGLWPDKKQLTVAFSCMDWSNDSHSAYRLVLCEYAKRVTEDIYSINFPGRNQHKSALLVREGIECLKQEDRSHRIQVLCELVNDLLGADATDIWMIDKQNSIVSIANGGYYFSSKLQNKFPDCSPERLLEKVHPRFDGITRRLAESPGENLFFLPNALMDSQAAEGTRELELKSVIGLQIRQASSLNTDAILWIRFLRKPNALCEGNDGHKLSGTWEENLRTIANFVHIVVFHEQYEHLFEEAISVSL